MPEQRIAKLYQWLIVACGAGACAYSAWHLGPNDLNWRFLFLSVVTLGLGSRIIIEIPRARGTISVSDTFIFLAVILFGTSGAVLLAAADGFASSLRFNKKPLTNAFNAGVMAFSTLFTATLVHKLFGVEFLGQKAYSPLFIVAICMLALAQYISNSWLVALGAALKSGNGFWHTWRTHFLWASITYIAGASAAGIIAKLIDSIGFYAFVATTPIITIIYFTYRTYLKNIEASFAQTEQAEKHVSALRASEARFRSAFDHAAGMALVAPDGRWLKVNHSLCRIVGYDEQELLATDFQSLTHPDDLGSLLGEIRGLLAGGALLTQTEQRYLHKNGYYIWTLLSVSKVHNPDSDALDLIFQMQDISDRKEAEERLVHNAFHDVLTGLPNRALFKDHLQLAINRSKRSRDQLYAVLFLDLDRFKVINDSLGHLIGDQLLVGIARRLESSLRPGDTVARLGGDEFTVLLEDLKGLNEVLEVANRLQHNLGTPFNLDGREVFTSVSIGIALSTIGYEHPDEVLRDADTAMYRAKMTGKARHEVFDRAMHARALNLLQLETDLRRAIEREELALHYQPIVDMNSGRISGFEALIRWHHPSKGFISPIDFIPIAEETGLIIPIGQWVLDEACRQVKDWQDRFPEYASLQMSVNLSGRQFTQSDLCESIKSTLLKYDINPRSIKLEITESMMMEDVEDAIKMLQQLRGLGIELSIDDFGTGYSSLNYLRRFPISTLKIDRSFVSQMGGGEENEEIVKTIVMLAKNLNMDVIAEGIETEKQRLQLMALRCQYGQGYLFSRPLNPVDAAILLKDNRSFNLDMRELSLPDDVVEHTSRFVA